MSSVVAAIARERQLLVEIVAVVEGRARKCLKDRFGHRCQNELDEHNGEVDRRGTPILRRVVLITHQERTRPEQRQHADGAHGLEFQASVEVCLRVEAFWRRVAEELETEYLRRGEVTKQSL